LSYPRGVLRGPWRQAQCAMTTALASASCSSSSAIVAFEGIQFAGAFPRSGRARRLGQVLGDGSASQVKMACDLAFRPVLGEVQAMNGVDLFCRQHALARYKTAASLKP